MDSGLVLTPEFTHALELLGGGGHLFLTGRAGTGKSTLIRHFMAQTGRRVVVTAPTGIAALAVDGYTIHRLFSFSPRTSLENIRGGDYYPHRFAAVLRTLDTLIIDEASMVRADQFDQLSSALERFGPRPGTPFGGVQIVLVGDLFQLPPVITEAERSFFDTRYATPYFFSADHYRGEYFPIVTLTHVFRQQGDAQLLEILNAVREGRLLDGARDILNQRRDSTFEPAQGEFWLTLTTTNRIATSRNKRLLDRLVDPRFTHPARVTGDLDQSEAPADYDLELAVGAQVMMLNNDAGGRWVNGTIGRVSAIDTPRIGPPRVTVACRDGGVVHVEPHTWEITRPVPSQGRLRHEVIGTFTQLPMRLAWAVTIHKSQGQTLDRVIVDLTGGTFATGQLYVALSRCTSFAGLVLTRDVAPQDLSVDPRVRRFLIPTRAGPESRVTGPGRGHAYFGLVVVGNEGPRYRPRPVELAVVTDHGAELTTLINPTSDLFNARTDHDIHTRDIQFAPLLSEAWGALVPHLVGLIPVGVDIDRTLGLIDFELKRGGHLTLLPTGVSIDPALLSPSESAGLRARSALERARATRTIAAAHNLDAGDAETFEPAHAQPGYLLPRGSWPESLLNANLHRSDKTLASLVQRAADRTHLDAEALTRLAEAERLLGHPLLTPEQTRQSLSSADRAHPAQVLTPGARLCFTGTVLTESGHLLTREAMSDLAEAAGFVPVARVTKSRCDALIVAEAGSQSSKTKQALTYNTPVITASEFLATIGHCAQR